MVDGLDSLRHHAVICCDNQHCDIRRLGAAKTHGGEGLVARRIEEGDGSALDIDGVGADRLGDAARLLVRDLRVADVVEEGGLAVIDMAHDDDDGRAVLQGCRIVLILCKELLDFVDLLLLLAQDVVIRRDVLRLLVGDLRIHGGHPAGEEQLLDDLCRLHVHGLCEIADREFLRDRDDLDLLLGCLLFLHNGLDEAPAPVFLLPLLVLSEGDILLVAAVSPLAAVAAPSVLGTECCISLATLA